MFSRQTKIRQPEYILIDRLPGTEIPLLLGRVVASVDSPMDEYRPEDPRPALQGRHLEVWDQNFDSQFSRTKNADASTKVTEILGFNHENMKTSEEDRKAKFVRTRSLPQHRDALAALMDRFRTPILQLLGENKGTAFMIVGIKSCVDGTQGARKQIAKKRALLMGLPTSTIITAASHGIISTSENLDVQFGVSQDQAWSVEATSDMVGEQVFAIRYRRLTMKKAFLSDKGKYVSYGDVEKARFDGGVFDSTDQEEISDDELEEEEEEAVDAFDDGDVELSAESCTYSREAGKMAIVGDEEAFDAW